MKQGIRMKAVVFLCLLLMGIGVINAQNYSTLGEIYDFDIGDIFHFSESCFGSGGGFMELSIINIVDKTFSADSNTVSYSQFIQTYLSSSPNPQWEYDEYYDTIWYSNLNNLYIADTIYTNSSYNGRKISYKDLSSGIYWIEDIYAVDGCGIAVWFWRQIDLPSAECELRLEYFKKGTEEWGTPLVFLGMEESEVDEDSFKCYPNPFTTSTTIEFEIYSKCNIQYSIYNSIGEIVFESAELRMDPGSQKVTWSPNHLPGGMYYAVLRSEDGVSVVKMLKE